MADSRKTVQIKSDPVGDVRIADEVQFREDEMLCFRVLKDYLPSAFCYG